MTIYTWPETRTFVPQQADLRVVDNTQRALESPMSGFVQTFSMPGARWGWGMDFGGQDLSARAALEAYLLRLSGREHRVRLWDLKQPRPRGIIQLAGVTLGAAATQFATTLQLAGCRGANVLLGGSFEVDSNADGIADGWDRYYGGTTGSRTQALATAMVTSGAKGQELYASGLGSASTDRQGIYRGGVPVACLAGKAVTMACNVSATPGTSVVIAVDWNDASDTFIPGYSLLSSVVPSTPGQLLQVSGTCPTNAAYAAIYIYQHSGPGGAVLLYVDSARLVAGTSSAVYPDPATLRGGDWIGLASGQLVRVVADAMATDAGAMTVDVRHMLRSAVASGSAVTLDKPTALFVRTESGLMLPRIAGSAAPGMSAEFVEVFA